MPNVVIPNFSLLSSNTDVWSVVWKLTRALKNAGWRYKASGDATAKDTTGNPANDKWGGGVIVGAQTGTTSFTIGTPSTTAKGGRVTISGLSGFDGYSPGHFLTITGATNSANNGTWLITKFNSSSSVDIENPNAVAETTPGGATWTEISSLNDSMPAGISGASGVGAWWCAEGPATIKIPIGNTVPNGTFVRGENVTQSNTGATGELLGVMTDPVSGGAGHIVICPRKSGTGAGPRGWSASDTITGSYSGATITPTSTPIEFVREIVIWKNSISNGHWYTQVIDNTNESTATALNGKFSILAAQAQCTATVCPGGAGSSALPTANGFPTTGTRVIFGTGGSGAATTGSATYFLSPATSPYGLAQIMAANNIEDNNISMDGSFVLAIGTPAIAPTTFLGFAFQRCDDGEEGDLDPYVYWCTSTATAYTGWSRTAQTTGQGAVASGDAFTSARFSASDTPYHGWRRRGFPTDDSFQEFEGAMLGLYGTTSLLALNTGTIDRIATAPVTTAVRESIWVVSTQANSKMWKGTLRWLYFVGGGSGTDTYDGKRWIQLSSTNVPVVAGPWDGATTPSNS